MDNQLKAKFAKLPKDPGVYFHKDARGRIIYVGKAARLSNRVRQYFQPSTARTSDPKTQKLISQICDTDWVTVDNELEALFLEAEMIKRYQPIYNILERDDKASTYVRIDRKSVAPSVTTTRQPLDDGAEYYGPFLHAFALRRALKYLRRIFPYSTHLTLPKRACLQFHLGLCPGPETEHYDRVTYLKNLRHLIAYLKGRQNKLVKDLEKEMVVYAKTQQYEKAASVRNQLRSLQALSTQIIFSDKESLDLSKDHALVDLQDLLGLPAPPRRVEGYDISHMSGTSTTASMVVFTNGVSDKSAYRKFKMRLPGNDDFAHMHEVVSRRLSPTNARKWSLPQLMLIDGGKGQLGAAVRARNESGQQLSMVGLAKQFEQIIVSKNGSLVNVNSQKLAEMGGHLQESQDFLVIDLPHTSHLVKLLQRIRDESHRFAISYHSTLKIKAQKLSLLDEIPGVGPATRKKLLRTFGSVAGITQARQAELAATIGENKAAILRQYLRSRRSVNKTNS